MTSTDVNQFLQDSAASKHPAWKWSEIGQVLKGVITEQPKVVNRPTFDGQSTENQLVIAITDEEGNTFALWVRKGFLAGAIQDAVTTAGAPGLEVGGRLAVKYSEDRSTGKPSPAKVFVAQYQPPTPAPVGVDSSLL